MAGNCRLERFCRSTMQRLRGAAAMVAHLGSRCIPATLAESLHRCGLLRRAGPAVFRMYPAMWVDRARAVVLGLSSPEQSARRYNLGLRVGIGFFVCSSPDRGRPIFAMRVEKC